MPAQLATWCAWILGGAVLMLPGIYAWSKAVAFYYGEKPTGWFSDLAESKVLSIAALAIVSLASVLGAAMIVWTMADILRPYELLTTYSFPDMLLPGSALIGCVYFVILLIKRRRFMQRMRDPVPRCAECGYTLSGLRPRDGQLHCPECGNGEALESVVERLRVESIVAEKEEQGIFH